MADEYNDDDLTNNDGLMGDLMGEEFLEEEDENEAHPVDILIQILGDPVNIADRLEDTMLTSIGSKVAERVKKDEESMKEWFEFVKWGKEVNKQTREGRDLSDGAPFENASNFKSPIMREAALKWSDRASTEILRPKELVKYEIVSGYDDAIKDKGERLAKHLNYQVNYGMDWRAQHDKMLYELPSVGCVFKKTFFNSVTGKNETNLIHYPNFVISNEAISTEKNAFAEKISHSYNEIIENQRSGIWLDTDLNIEIDEEYEFIEYHGCYDIDEDGYEEPYIITVMKSDDKVVRIVPRFEAEDVSIRNDMGTIITLEELVMAAEPEVEVDLSGVSIVKIDPINYITKYGFIPSDDGSYLDWGYFHVLGHLTSLINAGTNMMLDAGKLANSPTGFLSKAFRKAKNIVRLTPGEFKQTDLHHQDLSQGIYQIPFKGADQSLLDLIRDITQQTRQFSSSIDLSDVLSANAPASTTLALIQESMVSSSAIIARVFRSTSEELKVLSALNLKYTDPEEYKFIVQDETADFAVDYSDENVNVIPTANPELSSKMERIQLAEVALAQMPTVKENGGNPIPLLNNFFDCIGYKGYEEIFKQTEGQASAAQQIQMQQQQLQQQQQAQTQQQMDMLDEQQEIEKGKLELEIRKQDWKEEQDDLKKQVDDTKAAAELDKTAAQTALIDAQSELTEQKAITEDMKNDIAILKIEIDAIKSPSK